MAVLGILFASLVGAHVIFTLKAAAAKRPDGNGAAESLISLIFTAGPFLVLCCSGRRAGSKYALLGAYFQAVVFMAACWFGYHHGVFSRQLVSPLYIGLGLLAGHLIFGVSLLVTQQSLRASAEHFVDFHALWNYMIESPSVLLQFASVSIAEEMIYRVALQPLVMSWTGSTLAGIAIVAVVFSCVHEHFFRNEFMQSVEFMGFALLLGALYYWTGSLILVIVIHAVRNIEIAFLEYLIRLEETESEDAAARESEFLAGERLAVFVVAPACEASVAYMEYTAWVEPTAPGARQLPSGEPARACSVTGCS